MEIRSFKPGDDAAQVSIYNEAAAQLPKFKPVTLDEVRRRLRGPDFDPAARFFAVADGRPVAYQTFHPGNGRVSYPWHRPGHEPAAAALLERVLAAMKERGLTSAFAAYRADWTEQGAFFEGRGFRKVREMHNFVLDPVDLPTPAARPASQIGPLTPEDLPAALALAPGVPRARTVEELGRHLFHNPYFGGDASFALRGKVRGAPAAVGVLIANAAYADPKQVDAAMPCFRLGAFGTEGMTTKRINGLFSFLAGERNDVSALGLDLLGHALMQLETTEVATLAAQVPSDAPHLLHFYKQYFRPQGSFPIFERSLV
jgi:hypothetical protein